jgi:hypothetical protein
MASKYSDLFTQIIPEAGDINPAMVESIFRRCMTRYLERSQIWRTAADFDLASATPDPGTRASLWKAYQATQALSNASPNYLTLAQAAVDAKAAAMVQPSWCLTPPVQTTNPTTVYYTARAFAQRVTYRGCNANPYWQINPETTIGSFQTLQMLPPVSCEQNGMVWAYLYWVPFFDSDPSLAVPTWVYEYHGDKISDWTIGELWMRRRGRRADQALGQKMVTNAMIDADRARAKSDRENPLPMSI